MQLYIEIARRSFRRAIAYRAAALAGMVTNAFFGAVRCFVYIALFSAGSSSVAGFTLQDAISYTWLTQSLISIGAGWLTIDLSRSIYSGDVITDLMRPWSFYGYWLSRKLGEQLFNLAIRGTFTYVIGIVTFGAVVPSWRELAPFIFSVGMAMLLSITFSFLVNLTAFWLIDNTGVVIISNILLGFFSGFMIPLAFFPSWLATIAYMLPFQAISGLPAQIFLGQITGWNLIWVLALQLFWVVVLILSALAILQLAMRKVVIQGG
ncbi:MAG: ABC-2 family transporter protein [Chloroflexota bacterium]